jgi:hypothetical protein
MQSPCFKAGNRKNTIPYFITLSKNPGFIMRRLFFLVAMVISLAVSCNNKTNKQGEEKSIDSSKIQQDRTEAEKKMEELQNLPPVAPANLSSLLPETFMGVPKTNEAADNSMGAGSISAVYPVNDSTRIRITIYDCSGPAGAGIYNTQFISRLDFILDNEKEYTKTIELNDNKAIEHCMKTRVECSLTYFSGNQFLVTLDGENMTADALKDAAKSLNIK